MTLSFAAPDRPHWSDQERIDEIHAAPKIGQHFGEQVSDHMAVADWTVSNGWSGDAITDYQPLAVNPANAVLHYAQEIFEGLKAYRHADGSVWLFRPEENARRLNTSAKRLALPHLPEEDFLTAVRQLVATDSRWVPDPGSGEKSLYLRPVMFANDDFLGVAPAGKVRFAILGSPVGAYFSDGVRAVDIWVERHEVRAVPGGTGAAKCGGNYAASLTAQLAAQDRGCAQVLFLDAVEHTWIEELGGMNFMAVTNDGRLLTPELTGSILSGITRKSILRLAHDLDLVPVERRISIDELHDAVRAGTVQEAFACGTAAVVTPIGALVDENGRFELPSPIGEVTMTIRQRLLDIQFGRVEDPYGWTQKVC